MPTRPLALCALLLGSASPALAQSITFTDVSDDAGMGLDGYSRTPSALLAATQGLQQASLVSPIPMEAIAGAPHRPMGFPGVALLDADNDGDLDAYVTNGAGAANSLFRNQLVETGSFYFVDDGATSGADATSQESNGVCYGDIDNDGDDDLLVLGRGEANRLFENLGGTFSHVADSGLEGGSFSHIGCAMGDINGDGLIDVFVGNSFNMDTQLPLIVFPYSNDANQLYVNQGGLSFTDTSATSGILDMNGISNGPPQATTITWTVAMADVDLDGDMDLLQGDDQGPYPEEALGGADRAYMHIWINDGTGNFFDEVIDLNGDSVASWMGVDLADFDGDGTLDFFGGNFGDYMGTPFGIPYTLGHFATRTHFGVGDGTFIDPGAAEPTAFSWGTAVADLDNDGDFDATYHGGLDMTFIELNDNPGVVMVNDGAGNFTTEAGGYDADYNHRSVQGVAAGDLNGDGFIDIFTAADHVLSANAPLIPSPSQYGHLLDATAFFTPQFAPDANGMLVWLGIPLEQGVISVEINDGQSGLSAVRVDPVGSTGVTSQGQHNRGGVGAMVTFAPWWGTSTMMPISGGSSFLSQHESIAHFGAGYSWGGTVDVMWNGGHKNRMYWVWAGDEVTFPEIGCSFDTNDSYWTYASCVSSEVGQLESAGTLGWYDAYWYEISMLIAYWD